MNLLIIVIALVFLMFVAYRGYSVILFAPVAALTWDVDSGAIPYVLYHHERWDGTGYPSGKAGEEIPLEARVLAIADAFDAMTSDRPYRRALTRDEALAEVDRCAGTQFDPRIAEVFVALFAETELRAAASA